nr:hypothetical protein [Crucivirus sp.]
MSCVVNLRVKIIESLLMKSSPAPIFTFSCKLRSSLLGYGKLFKSFEMFFCHCKSSVYFRVSSDSGWIPFEGIGVIISCSCHNVLITFSLNVRITIPVSPLSFFREVFVSMLF